MKKQQILFSSLFVAISIFSQGHCYDEINKKYGYGSEVVVAAIRRVQDTCIFENDLLFMRRVAFYETVDGTTSYWDTDKGLEGIWQNDYETLADLLSSPDSQIIAKKAAIYQKMQVNVDEFQWQNGDLEIPLKAIAASRLWVSSFQNYPIPYSLDGQAEYWAKYYKNPNSTATALDFIVSSNKMKKCKPPGKDLIFVMDSSASIGTADFEHARNFMISIINSSGSDPNNNRIGVIQFSDSAYIYLNLTNNFEEATQVAEDLLYEGGDTNMFEGLSLAVQMFSQDAREGVPLVVLMVTDGQWNDGGDPTSVADDLKSMGVNLFTIGVGAEAPSYLQNFASSPNCMFYYSLNGYAQLAEVFPELLNAQICEVSAVASENSTSIPCTVEKDQSLYYQIPATLSSGITLKLDIHEGSATVYASLTSRLPSPADYDFVANATAGNLGQIYISPEEFQNVFDNSTLTFVSDMVSLGNVDITVYAAVIGLSNSTNFTLHYEPHDTEVPTSPQASSSSIEKTTTKKATFSPESLSTVTIEGTTDPVTTASFTPPSTNSVTLSPTPSTSAIPQTSATNATPKFVSFLFHFVVIFSVLKYL